MSDVKNYTYAETDTALEKSIKEHLTYEDGKGKVDLEAVSKANLPEGMTLKQIAEVNKFQGQLGLALHAAAGLSNIEYLANNEDLAKVQVQGTLAGNKFTIVTNREQKFQNPAVKDADGKPSTITQYGRTTLCMDNTMHGKGGAHFKANLARQNSQASKLLSK